MSSSWTQGQATPQESFEDQGPLAVLAERLRPDEGWTSLFFLLIMAAIMAWSIADARWVLGQDQWTAFVIPIAVLGALWGYVSSRLPIPAWLAQVLGTAVGAVILIEVVGYLLSPPDANWMDWLQATAKSVTQAYLDLTWRHLAATTQVGHFSLIIGIIVWGTAQSASYDVFGYHRAINGLLLMSMLLIVNMALTANDQFFGLILYSAAALGLLLETHAADEKSGWLRRRIWHAGDFRLHHNENGFGFASLAIAGALVLTTVASSAPLASFWNSSDFTGAFQWLQKYLPQGGNQRPQSGPQFGDFTTIGPNFRGTSKVIFTVNVGAYTGQSHWRAVAFDEFQSNGWSVGKGPGQTKIGPDTSLTGGTLDAVTSKSVGRLSTTYTITVVDSSLNKVVLASEPGMANVTLQRQLVGQANDTDVASFSTDAKTYTITSYVPDTSANGKGLTQWRLQHAGTDFPPGIELRYLQGVEQVGDPGRKLLAEIQAWAAQKGYPVGGNGGFASEYDAAAAMQDFMRDPSHFTYDINIGDLVSKCVGLSTVDCFATYKRGFCEQYATTMTMEMRLLGYPARYVQGFLAGHLDEHTRTESVTGLQSHAWVEVYFPSYGWIPFDPTGGSVGQPLILPVGSALPTASLAAPSGADNSGGNGEATRHPGLPGDGGANPPPVNGNDQNGLLLPIIGLTAIAALVGLFFAYRRRPQRLQPPGTLYSGIVRLASRLGYRPAPTQTVYEYAGMLAEVVPTVKLQLSEVAAAQVEVAYGQHEVPPDRLPALQQAGRRIREALLRLIFVLPGRRPKPTRTRATPGPSSRPGDRIDGSA